MRAVPELRARAQHVQKLERPDRHEVIWNAAATSCPSRLSVVAVIFSHPVSI
jgi:hypothetical protein